MMILVKNMCFSGWNMQYYGFLVIDNDDSGWYVFDFVCFYGDVEYLMEGVWQYN